MNPFQNTFQQLFLTEEDTLHICSSLLRTQRQIGRIEISDVKNSTFLMYIQQFSDNSVRLVVFNVFSVFGRKETIYARLGYVANFFGTKSHFSGLSLVGKIKLLKLEIPAFLLNQPKSMLSALNKSWGHEPRKRCFFSLFGRKNTICAWLGYIANFFRKKRHFWGLNLVGKIKLFKLGIQEFLLK